jgi:hypothetical protein
MQHEYIFMNAAYNYNHNGGSWTHQIRKTSYLAVQNLATSATISTLTDNRGAVTELMM